MSKHGYYEWQAMQFRPMEHMNRLVELFQGSEYEREVVEKWRAIFREVLREESYPPRIPLDKETFTLIVGYSTGSFPYIYNIDRSQAYFEQTGIKPIQYPVKKAILTVDQDNLEYNQSYKNDSHNNPIIIVESPIYDKPMCINGNHRIDEARRKGISTVELFWLDGEKHVPLLLTKLSKVMYLMSFDLFQLTEAKQLPLFEELHLFRIQEWLSE